MNRNRKDNFYRLQAGSIPLDESTYVEREADSLVRQFVYLDRAGGRMCWILAPRQMGKSSLVSWTIGRLPSEQFLCVQLDFQTFRISANKDSIEGLCESLLHQICRQIFPINSNINWNAKLSATWNHKAVLTPILEFKHFIIEEILTIYPDKKLIICIDEIQNIMRCKQQDEFIRLLKHISEDTNLPELQRLAFVVLGVARPSDLTNDYTTVINTGTWVELEGLQEANCQPLWPGIEHITSNPKKVIHFILKWTGGQPYLTQLICDLVANADNIPTDINIENHVNLIVKERVIQDWKRQESRSGRLAHLQEIENWFIRDDSIPKEDKLAALKLYREIVNGQEIKFEQKDSIHWHLLMSGLVISVFRENHTCLEVANQIYKLVFTRDWSKQAEESLNYKDGGLNVELARVDDTLKQWGRKLYQRFCEKIPENIDSEIALVNKQLKVYEISLENPEIIKYFRPKKNNSLSFLEEIIQQNYHGYLFLDQLVIAFLSMESKNKKLANLVSNDLVKKKIKGYIDEVEKYI